MPSAPDTSSATYRGGLKTLDAQRKGRDKAPEIWKMRDGKEGVILNYRMGTRTQDTRQCLIKVIGVEPSEARRMIGLKVGWPIDDPKIYGKIVDVQGRTGTLRVRFNRGVLGQALGSRVKIFE